MCVYHIPDKFESLDDAYDQSSGTSGLPTYILGLFLPTWLNAPTGVKALKETQVDFCLCNYVRFTHQNSLLRNTLVQNRSMGVG